MAYKGTNDDGTVFTGGDPSKEEEQIGEAQEEDAEEWEPDGVKGVWDL